MTDRSDIPTSPAIGSVEEAYRALNEATILRESAEQYQGPEHTSPDDKLAQADDLEEEAWDFLDPDDNDAEGELVPQSQVPSTSACPPDGGSRELVPHQGESRELVTYSEAPSKSIRPRGRAAAIASNERLSLAGEARSTELAIDMAESLEPANSAELGLTHQMAAAHALALRIMGRANLEIEGLQRHRWQEKREAMVEICRLTNAGARMMQSYQQGLAVLAKVRNGGKQTVVVQHVQVNDGGQAVIAAQAGGRPGRSGGRREK
jgi:hypothetical protein